MADGNESSSDEEGHYLLNDIAPPSLPEIVGIDQQFRTHRPPIKFSGFVETLIVKRTNEYQYDELGLKQIRLLRLTKGERNDDIQCVLTPIKLSRRSMPDLPYQALSYVWGTDNPTKHIQILDAKDPVKKTERSAFAPTRWGDFAYMALVQRRAELVRGKMPSAKKFYVRANLYAALGQSGSMPFASIKTTTRRKHSSCHECMISTTKPATSVSGWARLMKKAKARGLWSSFIAQST
jgi:hypothetical protein